jgi:hypothetical protein
MHNETLFLIVLETTIIFDCDRNEKSRRCLVVCCKVTRYTGCLKIASTKKNLVIGDGELKSSAKENSNKNPLVFEIKITKNWVKIVSAPLS